MIDRDDYFLLRGTGDLKARFYVPSLHFSFYKERFIYSGVSEVTDKSEAQKLATPFLMRQPIFRFGKGELAFEEVRFVKGIGISKERVSTKLVLHNTIAIFSRRIDGRRQTGPGSRVVVFLGDNREVVGFKAYGREVSSRLKIVRIDQADKFIEHAARRVESTFGPNGFDLQDIRVEKFECAYFAQGKHVVQRFLQPAYVLAYVVKNKWINAGRILIGPAHSAGIEPLEGSPVEPLSEEQKREQKARPS